MAESERETSITTPNRETSKFKRVLPWLSALLATISIIVAASALITGECHYRELTKPQAQLAEINIKQDLLDEKLGRIQEMLGSSDNIFGVSDDYNDKLNDAKHLREIALSAVLFDQYTDALQALQEAISSVDEIIPEESYIYFKQGKEISITATAAPFEGWVDILIGNETTAMTNEGEPLTAITLSNAWPPTVAENQGNIVYAFEITPDGVIFSEPIRITAYYLPTKIPSSFREADLVMATWDWNTSQWNILPNSRVDAVEHSITISVKHLTLFAVLGMPPSAVH